MVSDDSKVELSLPLNVNLHPSLSQLERVFNQFGVFLVEKPFASASTPSIFDKAYRISFDPSFGSAEDFAIAMQLMLDIEFAEQIPIQYPLSFDNQNSVSLSPDDPLVPYHLELIKAYEAFDIHQGGTSVGIVDNNFFSSHPDLVGTIVSTYDAGDVDFDVNPSNNIWSLPQFPPPGHGTEALGVLASETNNAIGVSSVGWNHEAYVVKAGHDEWNDIHNHGVGSYHAYDGIRWLDLNSPVEVISMSFASPFPSQLEYLILQNAFNNGRILVAGAGNSNSTLPLYPAAYGEGLTGEPWEQLNSNLVIAVGALDQDNNRSIWGLPFFGSQFGSWVDICAYGTDILTTSYDADFNPIYKEVFGTSYACPMVASAVGLMRSYRPDASSEDIINCLIASANDDIYTNSNLNILPNSMGRGRLDVEKALLCISDDCSVSPLAHISSSSNYLCKNAAITLTASIGSSYLWSTGAVTQEISILDPGVYSVEITYQGGCTSVAEIVVSEPPISQITSDEYSGNANDGIICANDVGEQIYLTAWEGGTYNWSNGENTQSVQVSMVPNVTYSVTISNAYGCGGNDQILETSFLLSQGQIGLPEIYIEEESHVVNDGNLCLGDEVTLSTNTQGSSYQWSSDVSGIPILSTEPQFTITPDLGFGLYYLTVTNSDGCVETPPVPAFTLTNECSGCDCNFASMVSVGNSGQAINASSFFSGDLTSNSCFEVSGTINWDIPEHTLRNNYFLMNQGAKIVVNNGNKLLLDQNTFEGCDAMWEGIHGEGYNAEIYSSNFNKIADAKYGIQNAGFGVLSVENSIFDRNYIDVHIPEADPNGFIPFNLVWVKKMENNQFLFSDGLKDLTLNNGWGEAALKINDQVFCDIGPNNLITRTTNSYYKNGGIEAKNSLLSIYENTISNLYQGHLSSSPLFSKAGIRLEDCIQADIQDNTLDKNTLGIVSVRSNMSVKNNIIKADADFSGNLSESCMYVIQGDSREVEIEDNTFDIGWRGLVFNLGSPLSTTVKNNTFNTVAAGSAQNGIEFLSWKDNTLVSQNQMLSTSTNPSAKGIIVNNSEDLTVYDNTLKDWSTGIKVTGGNNNYIAYNKVLQESGNANIGFDIENSTDWLCKNSTGALNNNGFIFKGMSTPTRFECNTIGATNIGLSLDNSAIIGNQINRGNQWDNNMPFGAFGAQHESSDFALVSLSVFESPSSEHPNTWATGVGPNTLNWFQNGQANECSSACPQISNEDDPQGEPIDPGGIPIPNTALVNTDPVTVSGLLKNEATNWMAQQRLWERVSVNSEIANSDESVSTFFQENLSSDLASLYNISEQERDLLKNQEYIETFANILLELKNRTTDVQSTNAESFHDAQMELYTEVQVFKALHQEVLSNRILLSEENSLALEGIETSNLLAENEQIVQAVYLEEQLWESKEISESGLAQLYSIAIQCPNDGGFAVYKARNLYNLFGFEQSWEDCKAVVERSSSSLDTEENVIVVFPNPAKGEVNITWEKPVDKNCSLFVLDSSGKTIFTTHVTEKSTTQLLNTTEFKAGMYFVKMDFGDNTSGLVPLTIIK